MKILRTRKITRQKWINLYRSDYVHNGKSGIWVYASRRPQPVKDRTPDAVVMVPILYAPPAPPRLVLIKEYRVPAAGTIYALPAGLMEPGESIEESARREILEETGLRLVRVKRVSPLLFSTAGLSDEAAVMAFVDVKPVRGAKQALEGSEVIEVLLLDFEEVCRLCERPTVQIDAKAWLTLLMYKQLGKLE